MKTTNRRASGYALLLGVGSLDTGHYGTTGVELISPEKDVLDYELIASLNGFVVQSFVGDNATRTRLLNAMAKIAKSLKSGDFLLLTFSGFGGIVTNFGSKERQHISATWCLYDGQLLLSEIRQALSAFQNGVNVLIISDCSSILNGLQFQPAHEVPSTVRQRAMPVEIAETVYLKNKDFYDGIYLGTKSSPSISANIIWLSACQVNQVAYETAFNGYFTAAIKHQWNGGVFKGDYELFFNEVSLMLPPVQSPLLETFGEEPAKILEKKPFSI